MSLEQEIKLQVTQEQALDLNKLDWLMAMLEQPGQQIHLLSTYFDTPDLELKKFGAGLRLRQIGEQWLQTVKCTGKAENGLHQRKEWEHPLEGPEFDKRLLKQTELSPLVANAAIWDAIKPLFTTEFERLVMPLQLDDGTQVEMAYDRGEVRAGNKQTPIHEIELELKQGEIKKVQQLADQLKAALPLQYSDISKAAQGYSLYQSIEK